MIIIAYIYNIINRMIGNTISMNYDWEYSNGVRLTYRYRSYIVRKGSCLETCLEHACDIRPTIVKHSPCKQIACSKYSRQDRVNINFKRIDYSHAYPLLIK